MRRRLRVGLLYSLSGTYALLSQGCRAGALAAIEAVNGDASLPIEIEAVERDPAGNIDRYAPLAEELLRGERVDHIVGCITSWSRKEVIPALEKTGGTLWYAAPYEGFEANDHVVYMHACPNQHILPLMRYAIPRFGVRAFLVGSNYIWGWETNRIARDLVHDAGGSVLGERHLALGDEDVGRIVEEIRQTRPSFVLNNFVGATSYAFLKAYAELGECDPWFASANCPVLSCNLTEAELGAIGRAGEGHIAAGPFFDTRPTGAGARRSSFMMAAESAIRVLAQTVVQGGGAGGALDLARGPFDTPFGRIAFDLQTRHAHLPVHIARIEDGRFTIVDGSCGLVAPDPYLSRYDPHTAFARTLRVVS
ncbi:transporter substrate-binding protein [Pararhizobium mangrovi]|uniref:N-acetylmuramoyl-L-alanine amidase n=1 Tax=Pararhizobium mangrovi TaxID=2590452 RepID=A0A506UD26_9HYPH|nr:transporter substrate-binding protein [Pararhizobium mangrovi]TPW29647.1 N-acetylmuramoyl-L-alanine amidase [Pararhizobium mangrovi]